MVPALVCGFLASLGMNGLHAATPDTAPEEIRNTLQGIETAANRQDIDAVMAFYDDAFIHTDGFNRTTLESALENLWEQYSEITYRTELLAWAMEGEALVAETVTSITGEQNRSDRLLALEATIQSRQRFEAGKLIYQETISENSQLTFGPNPPRVEVNLPSQVAGGQAFNFDAIVEEPLGDKLLLGTAIDESVSASSYFTPQTLDLELLSAGGIFKIGKAPLLPEDQWISAVLIREDGIVLLTQRLRIGREE